MFGKKNENSSLKLVDFGLSAKYSTKNTSTLTEKCGTAIYMAPEVYTNYEYSKYVDIWSVGIIMYTIIGGKHPLYKKEDSVDSYLEKLKDPIWDFPSSFSQLA